MTNLLRVELDCWNDDFMGPDDRFDLDGFTAFIQANAAAHNLQASLADESGPGGGCPVYSFVGTPSDLKAYMREYHHAGLTGTNLEEELDFHLESAEPA